MKCFLLLLLVWTALALDHSQLEGLKKLLKKMKAGVYPTCQLVLFSELVDFETAEKNCEVSEFGIFRIFCYFTDSLLEITISQYLSYFKDILTIIFFRNSSNSISHLMWSDGQILISSFYTF